jgi:hypothetical protein
MLGYRLVREADWADLQLQLIELRERVIGYAMKSAEATITGATRSKDTMIDMLTTRLNALELESAHTRHLETGRPAVAATVGIGKPIRSTEVERAADIWEDVGDLAAREMSEHGILHGESVPNAGLESAASMTSFLDAKES